MNKADMARQVMEALPFSQALSMQIESLEDGRAVISMPYDPQFVGDPETGVIHGGAVSALMDTCCGAAVMSRDEGTGITATLDLRIDYMRPARPGQPIRAEAHCYHATRTVAFVRATASDGQGGAPVASAVGSFTFQRREDAR
jgi:uncharacterized protein (TIGR00369 family)